MLPWSDRPMKVNGPAVIFSSSATQLSDFSPAGLRLVQLQPVRRIPHQPTVIPATANPLRITHRHHSPYSAVAQGSARDPPSKASTLMKLLTSHMRNSSPICTGAPATAVLILVFDALLETSIKRVHDRHVSRGCPYGGWMARGFALTRQPGAFRRCTLFGGGEFLQPPGGGVKR